MSVKSADKDLTQNFDWHPHREAPWPLRVQGCWLWEDFQDEVLHCPSCEDPLVSCQAVAVAVSRLEAEFGHGRKVTWRRYKSNSAEWKRNQFTHQVIKREESLDQEGEILRDGFLQKVQLINYNSKETETCNKNAS